MNFISSVFKFFSRLFLILLFFILTLFIIAPLTNPSREDHMEELQLYIQQEGGDVSSRVFEFLKKFKISDYKYTNYIVASVVRKENKVVSIGFLNNIIMNDNLDQDFNF